MLRSVAYDQGLRCLSLFAALLVGSSLVQCGSPPEVVSKQAGPQPEHVAALQALSQSTTETGEAAWAVEVRLPVSWPQNLGLVAGEGELSYRGRMTKLASGAWTLALCHLSLPSYATRAFVGGERYQLDFVEGSVAGEAQSCRVRGGEQAELTLAWAVVLGAQLADPFDSPWPAQREALRQVALPAVGAIGPEMVGAPLVPREGDGFSLPAVNRLRTRRARQFFTALRHRFELQLHQTTAGRWEGRVAAPSGGWEGALQSATLGCLVGTPGDEALGRCSELELSLANTMAPQLRVKEGGAAVMVPVPLSTSCQDIADFPF